MRAERRIKSTLHAFATDIEGKYDVKCAIRDVSKKGCRIVTNALADLPEFIYLMPEGFEKPILGRIVWRSNNMAGVEFMSSASGIGFLVSPLKHAGDRGPSGLVDIQATLRGSNELSFRDRLNLIKTRWRNGNYHSNLPHSGERPGVLKDFVSMIVHEFRTPLTSLLGSFGLIRHSASDAMPKQTTALLDVAQRNAEKLKLMVDDLLDLGKAEAGKMQLSLDNIEIGAFARDSIEVNRPFARKYGILLRLDNRLGKAFVRADAARLDQVLTNLLSNAIKFSPQGRAVDVIVEREAGNIRVSVRDHGRGISRADQRQIFEKFVQVHGADSSHTHGTGLGLSVSKSIVEMHDGTIGVKSEPGAGSTFYFELPEISAVNSENERQSI